MTNLDPRWEWIEITQFGSPGPEYIKGACNHLDTEPVITRDRLTRELGGPGEIVAHLCLTCGAQLEHG